MLARIAAMFRAAVELLVIRAEIRRLQRDAARRRREAAFRALVSDPIIQRQITTRLADDPAAQNAWLDTVADAAELERTIPAPTPERDRPARYRLN